MCPEKETFFKRTFYHLTINFQWIYDMIPSWELTYPHPRYAWRWLFPFPKICLKMYFSYLEGNSTKPLFQVLQELAGIHSKWFEWMPGLSGNSFKFCQSLLWSSKLYQKGFKLDNVSHDIPDFYFWGCWIWNLCIVLFLLQVRDSGAIIFAHCSTHQK